jgi:hypothetical protein
VLSCAIYGDSWLHILSRAAAACAAACAVECAVGRTAVCTSAREQPPPRLAEELAACRAQQPNSPDFCEICRDINYISQNVLFEFVHETA